MTPHYHREDVRKAAKWLHTLGFKYTGFAGGHPSFEHPSYGRTSLPLTPSESQRWQQNWLSRLARRMGKTKFDLELQLGLREGKSKTPKVRRQRNEAGRSARTFSVVRETTPPPGTHWNRGRAHG